MEELNSRRLKQLPCTPGEVKKLELITVNLTGRDFCCDTLELIEDEEDKVVFKLGDLEQNNPELSSALASLKTVQDKTGCLLLELTAEEVRDLPHSILMEALSYPTVSKAMADFGNKIEGFDKLTPDYIQIQEGKVLVMEFKTHKTPYYENQSGNWLGDEWKYWRALNEKITSDITIYLATVYAFWDALLVPEFLLTVDLDTVLRAVQGAWSLQRSLYSKTRIHRFPYTPDPVIHVYKEKLTELKFPEKEDSLHLDETFCSKTRVDSLPKEILVNCSRITTRICKRIVEMDNVNVANIKERKMIMLNDIDYISDFERTYRDGVKEILSTLGQNSNHRKNVVQHPFASVLNTGWDLSKVEGTFTLNPQCAEGLLWDKYLFRNFGNSRDERFSLETLELDEEVIYKTKSKRFIEVLKIDKNYTLDLGVKGVRGKRFRWTKEKREKEKENRSGFPLEVFVDDIDSFIREGLKSDSDWIQPTEAQEPLLDMIESDYRSVETKLGSLNLQTHVEKFSNKLRRTKLFRALRVLEAIVSEVNYSRQTNLREEDSYIVKKVPGVDMLVMIVPSRADRHIFYSVLVPKDSIEVCASAPFKSLMPAGDFFISEFVSLDQDRISHLLGCSNKLLSIFVQKLQTNYPQDALNFLVPDAWNQECALSLLVFLEDKAQTSTALLLVRYAYMDLFVCKELNTHPLKILNKMPKIVRSRLLIWIINKVICSFNEMYQNKVKGFLGLGKCKPSSMKVSQDTLTNFKSWITGEPVEHVSHMLDLSYLGHLHNKEEGEGIHGNLQIFSKLVNEELKMRDSKLQDLLGTRELSQDDFQKKEILKSHEFNKDFVTKMAFVCRKKLYIKLKERYPMESATGDILEWYLIKSLSDIRLQDLATTKASACDLVGDQLFNPDDKDSKYRKKVMAAMHDLVDSLHSENVDVLDVALDCLSRVKQRTNKGVLVNLFKKQQLGGPREIFVLTFLDRYCIHILEKWSRSLCELLENEMLTKGDSKLCRSDDHMRKVFEKTSESSQYQISGASSSDATTWCQRFTMQIMGTFFVNILPQSLHPFLCHVLNSITSKRLQLPVELLKLWLANPEIQSVDPGMQELKRQFLTQEGPHDLIDYRSRMLKNRSNFMQGILHYSSSLVHAAYLDYWALVLSKDLSRHGFDSVITTKCSSDDSSVVITILSPDFQRLENDGVTYIRRALLLINDSYWLFGAKSSLEKSTPCVFGLFEEFNSVWLVQNTIVLPLIKFVSSSFRTPPFCKLDAAQRQYASARSQLLSSGATFQLLKVIQFEQCLQHYKMLGLFSHEMGTEFYTKLRDTQNPNLGYFIQEPSLLVGLLGYDFAYYVHNLLNPKFRSVHVNMVNQKLSKLDSNLEHRVEITIGMGGLKRYSKLCEDVKMDRESIKSFYQANPEKLYNVLSTKTDLLKFIENKASKYETAEAFSGVKDSTTHNRSVYLSTSKVYIEKDWFDVLTTTKHTWFYLLTKFARELAKSDDTTKAIDWKETFALSGLYDEVMLIIYDEMSRQPSKCDLKRNLLVSRSLKAFEGPNLVPLSRCAAFKWFNLSPKSVIREDDIETSWKIYKRRIRWLRQSAAETLKSSGFEHHIELHSFLNSYEHKTKTMSVLCPMRSNISTEGFIRKAIRGHQWVMTKLKKTDKPNVGNNPQFDDDLTTLQLMSTIANICALPKLEVRNKNTGVVDQLPNAILKTLSSSNLVRKHYEKVTMEHSESVQCLKCLKFYDQLTCAQTVKERRESFENFLRESGTQYIHYNMRQKKTDGRWTGTINFDLIINGYKFNIIGVNNVLTHVKTAQAQHAIMLKSNLCRTLKEHGFSECRPNRLQKNIFINLHTGVISRERDLHSLPLFEDPDIDKRVNLPKDPTFKFVVEPHTLKLVETGTDTTVVIGRISRLNYFRNTVPALLEEALDQLQLPDFLVMILTSFCLNVQFSSHLGQALLRELPKQTTENSKTLKTWLVDVLTSRMRRKNFISATPGTALVEALTVEQKLEHIDIDESYFAILSDNQTTDDEILNMLAEIDRVAEKSVEETKPPSSSEVDLENSEASPMQIDEDGAGTEFNKELERAILLDDNTDLEGDQMGMAEMLGDFEYHQVKIPREPALITEKSWLDNLIGCCSILTKQQLLRMQNSKLRVSEATEDLSIFVTFMGWKLCDDSDNMSLSFNF